MLVSLVFTAVTAACVSATGMEPQAVGPEGTLLATVYKSCKNKGDVALTFDDGPYLYLEDISNALVAAGAHGTFFFNGNNFRCIYNLAESVKYAHAHGHMIGSHTYAHKDLTTLTSDQIHNEMWLVEQALQRIIGVTPAFMRPPYGLYNDLVRQVSHVRNQSLVIWDFDSGDSTGSSVTSSEALYAAVASKNPSNVLAVNHETSETTAHQVLPYAISTLKAAGYKLVTVAECLGLPAYQHVGTPGTPDPNTWKC
ncbi:carbohydrate esterase family 4 protein [Mycena alexandri]|uniref:Carbohydrate esterase family 4 protein n=1 Tax=Mycena alexandri TaxID=1745969 RepID=A0AAD6TA30_9AGAR|nr:carbohydrate esterase family 4 protein [Mycena alexandri]KAJ7041792.1 carbohydrate esterase family 4 protein [Mycena alexandri]